MMKRAMQARRREAGRPRVGADLICRTPLLPVALASMSPDFYRKEAERLRRLADIQTDPEVVQRLREMAAENDVLARQLTPNDNKPTLK